MLRRLRGLCVVFALACGSPVDSAPSDPPRGPPADDEARATDLPAPELPSPPEPPATPTEGAPHADPPSAEDIERMREALATARRLAHDSDWSASLTSYREALAAAPSGRVRCEAGFVALRAGADDLAEEWIKQALLELPPPELADSELRVPLAMCQYNAGLVLETRGRLGEAIAAFDRSLVLRANTTVEAARTRVVAALASSSATASVDTTPEVCSPVAIEDCLSSCTRGGALHDVLVRASPAPSPDAGCAVYEPAPPGAALGAPAYEARIVVEAPSRERQVGVTLRLEGAPGRSGTLFVDLASSDPTPGHESELLLRDASWVDAEAGGPPELLVRYAFRQDYEATRFDDASGWCREHSHAESELAMLCAIFDLRTGTELVCARIPLDRDRRATRDCASDPAALPAEPTPHSSERCVIALDAAGGRVELRLVEPVHGTGNPWAHEVPTRVTEQLILDAEAGLERLVVLGGRSVPLMRPGHFSRIRGSVW